MSEIILLRNKQIVLDVCAGEKLKDVATKNNISYSRATQILHEAERGLCSAIMRSNLIFSGNNNSEKLISLVTHRDFDVVTIMTNNSELYRAFINTCMGSNSKKSLEAFYLSAKNYQKIKIGKINEETRKAVKDVLLGAKPKEVAKKLNLSLYEFFQVIHLVCFTINPDFLWSSSTQDFVGYYRERKRLYVDQIDVDFKNLEYLGLLCYLNDGKELPTEITSAYLQNLFEWKFKFPPVCLCFLEKKNQEDSQRFKVELGCLLDPRKASSVILCFNNGVHYLETREIPGRYFVVEATSEDIKCLEDFNHVIWIELMKSVMLYTLANGIA